MTQEASIRCDICRKREFYNEGAMPMNWTSLVLTDRNNSRVEIDLCPKCSTPINRVRAEVREAGHGD